MQDFRPMSIPDILDATFRLYRDRFVTFLLIALIVYVPYSLLATFLTPAELVAAGLFPALGRKSPTLWTYCLFSLHNSCLLSSSCHYAALR